MFSNPLGSNMGLNPYAQQQIAYEQAIRLSQEVWDAYCERKRLHREMTAEDLGLPFGHGMSEEFPTIDLLVRTPLGTDSYERASDVEERVGHLIVHSYDGVLAIYAPGQWLKAERR